MIKYTIEITASIRGEVKETHYIESQEPLTEKQIYEMVKSGEYFENETYATYDIHRYIRDSMRISKEEEHSDKT